MSKKFELDRRKFLEGLGLGIGARVLSPLAGLIYTQAFAQSAAAPKVIFVITGEAWPRNAYPAEFINGIVSRGESGGRPLTNSFTWPAALAPLAAYRNKALLLDGFGLNVDQRSQHSFGFGPLAASGNSGSPGGITIDQHFAKSALFKNGTSFGSILSGVSDAAVRGSKLDTIKSTFATGSGASVSHIVSSTLLRQRTFAGLTGGPPDPNLVKEKAGDSRVLDALTEDITRLRTKLASPERAKLDDFTAAIENFERKNSTVPGTCGAPATVSGGSVEKELERNVDIATMAMKCGMTNVLGFAIATEAGHGNCPPFAMCGGRGNGDGRQHQSNLYGGPNGFHTAIMTISSNMIAKMLTTLSGQAGVMPDNTTVVFLPSNGTSWDGHHHGAINQFPVMILSSNARLLKGGYFRQYHVNRMNLGALWVTLGQALGVPTGGGFGDYSGGPLSELIV